VKISEKVAPGLEKPLYCKFQGGMKTAVLVQTLPNSTKCGGITEAWRVAWLAQEHNVLYVPHGWNTAVGLAADLHLTASVPGPATSST
jgi:hypothetical protein